MLGPIIDHLWQSTLIVLAAGAAALLLRRYSAQWRYWLWFAASMKFLVPFALMTSLGAQFAWREAPTEPLRSDWQTLAGQVLQPTTVLGQLASVSDSTAPSRGNAATPVAITPLASELPAQAEFDSASLAQAESGAVTGGDAAPLGGPPLGGAPGDAVASTWGASWTTIILAIWLLGTGLALARWLRHWLELRQLAERAKPLGVDSLARGVLELRSCSSIMEPGIFGIFRPVLLIPEGIVDRLTGRQLEAIVQHERVHIERKDNLTASLHMLVEALFWFYPFVWWIGARLVDERERACDEAVLAAGIDPDNYASGLIEVCDFYVQSPLLCTAGVGGGSLEGRVKRIADNAELPMLNRPAKVALLVAPIAVFVVPFAVGLLSTPVVRAQQAVTVADPNGLLACLDPDVLHGLLIRNAAALGTVYTGAVPAEMARVTAPIEFDWIGSMLREPPNPADADAGQITAAYRTDLDREAAREIALSALEADGWELQASPQIGITGSVFPSSMPPQPDLMCLGDDMVNLNIDVLDDTTYVTYVFPTSAQNNRCHRDPKSPFRSVNGVEIYMPQLEFPIDPETGNPPRRGGSGSSGGFNSRQSRTEIRHSASIDELAQHLSQQLVAQGWIADANWTGTTTAGSAWSKQADPQTLVQGTLDITRTGEKAYTIMFRVVAL